MSKGAQWPHDAILHVWWVEPGRLLAGEYPGARTPEKATEKVRLLVEAGVDSIVDLTTQQDGLAPYEDYCGSRPRRPDDRSITSPIPFRT